MALRCVDRLAALLVIGVGLAAPATVMPILEAQTLLPRQTLRAATTPNEDSVTVTGCLLLGPYGDFILSKTIAPPGSIMNSVAWKLEASQALLAHVLENVEVTGALLRTPSDGAVPASSRPADRSQTPSYRLRVKTIKKVGGCS
jgi:hypothetical protein